MQVLPNKETVTRYGFIHALYQNVLYDRLSSSRRIHLHRRIGEEGQQLYKDRVQEIAAELAMHFERGLNYRQAVKYLQEAAENDIRRFAYRDAVLLSRRGLALLQKLPDTIERAREELWLHITLGVPLIATEGYASPEVGRTYTRARQLCQRLGDTPEIAQVLWGLWTFYTLKGDLATARATAEEFLILAERLAYPGLALGGHWAMEVTLMHGGNFVQALEHFEKGLALYDPARNLDDAFLYAQDPAVAMHCFAAWTLWFLGRPDQALQRMHEALSLARQLSEPHGLAHALFFAAVLHQLRREPQMAQDFAEAAIAVSTEHSLPLYQAMAMITLGWSQIEQGQPESQIAPIRDGLAVLDQIHTRLLRPHFLALMAEALTRLQRPEEGLSLVDEAIVLASRNQERNYEAELYRLKGELLLMRSTRRARSRAATASGTGEPEISSFSEAEQCFNKSIQIAQQQQALSFELRAAISAARLLENIGRGDEARTLLSQTYGRFNEGLQAPDLLEAKSLLLLLSS
jgi:predicted ATPase